MRLLSPASDSSTNTPSSSGHMPLHRLHQSNTSTSTSTTTTPATSATTTTSNNLPSSKIAPRRHRQTSTTSSSSSNSNCSPSNSTYNCISKPGSSYPGTSNSTSNSTDTGTTTSKHCSNPTTFKLPPHGVYSSPFIDGILQPTTRSSAESSDDPAGGRRQPPPPHQVDTYFAMSRDSLKPSASSDVWRLQLDQTWVEFGSPISEGGDDAEPTPSEIEQTSSRGRHHRGIPFVEPIPVLLYLTLGLK